MKLIAVLLIALSSSAAEKSEVFGHEIAWKNAPIVEFLGAPKKYHKAFDEAAAYWNISTLGSANVSVEWVTRGWQFPRQWAGATQITVAENDIISAHVWINGTGAFMWKTKGLRFGFCYRRWKYTANIKLILIHELGHVLGYKHSDDVFDAMYAQE